MIIVENVSKRFADVLAVKHVSFSVQCGECLVLLGGSGSGKTTMLKMVNRLIEPSGGTIIVADRNAADYQPHELRRKIGYCFQRIGLFPHMTVFENIAATPKLLGWDDQRIQDQVVSLLEAVDLAPDDYKDRMPAQLSGGQQQRVGVARAMAAKPDVVLFDEPFGALDPITRERLQALVKRLQRGGAMTSIFVTHDIFEAIAMGDRIAVMHEGELLQIGTPRELRASPATAFVEEVMTTPERQWGALEKHLRA